MIHRYPGRGRYALAALFCLAGLTTAKAQAPATAPATPPAPATAPAPLPRIELKLFDKAEVDRSKGCSVVLWQDDRDPDKDRYAYLFVEPLGANHVRTVARVKIGNEILMFTRIAVGGRAFGYGLHPWQTYQRGNETSYLLLNLKLEDEPGEIVDIVEGRMTVIQSGKPPFVATVKGNAGCKTPAAPAPAPSRRGEAPSPGPASPPAARPSAPNSAPLAPSVPAMFEKHAVPGSRIPRGMIGVAVQRMGCEETVMRKGGTGYYLSEESSLWEIPCARFAYQGSSVFAIVYTPEPAKNFTYVMFDGPKGRVRSTDSNQLMNPRWDMARRIVTGISLGRGAGDCGVYERHRLGEDGQFTLIEYREKENCDGIATKPEAYPLIFRE